MDVSETKQENSETCIRQMIWDCIALIQRNIRDTHIYDFAMLKRAFPSKTANALLFNKQSEHSLIPDSSFQIHWKNTIYNHSPSVS